LLLQAGGNINAVDSEGLNPAMWACHFDQIQNLQVLHQALSRTDPEEDAIFKDTDCYGQSVIHWAVKGVGSLECLEALLSPQSAVLRDNDGKTVLHTAAEKGNSAACEMILEVRGNLEGLQDTDKMKRTPAHLAAICAQGEVLNFLLDRGADVLVKDSFGASAVDYIHNKQLNYCGMVLRAHAQSNNQKMAKTESHGDQSVAKPQPSAPPIQALDQLQETLCDQNIDVSELQGFDVQGGSGDMENEQSQHKTEHDSESDTKNADNENSVNKAGQKHRRQSTLTRQSGFVNDGDSRQSLEAPSFDLRTEDGNILVVVSNLDVEGDEQEQIIDVEDGDIEIDCVENFEYSSGRLQEGRGSASSVHSEPDNADNCSVSAELDVSSLGSDNEEELHEEEFVEHTGEGTRQKLIKGEAVKLQQQISKSHRRANEHSRQLPTPQDTVPPAKHPQKLVQLQSVHADENYIEYTEQGNFPVASKKKKDKTKKKKQKGPSVTELVAPLPPPRGMVPPLNSLGPPGVAKFGVLDPHGIKPAPWEHGSLGPLRQAPPDPAPPTSPRMGRAGFPHSEERFDHNEGAFERPRTPEPPQRSRDLGGHQTLQPSPPDASFRGPIEGGFYDREMGYGPSGPPHGPLAHANGQALLKNMDIMGRGPKMESWTGKNMGGVMPHGPPGPRPGQQAFVLHGPIPHPPQH